MFTRFFGSCYATLTTLLSAGLLAYAGFMFYNRHTVTHWGRHIALLALAGLVVCCFAAMRDNYHHSVEVLIQGGGTPGLFPVASMPSLLCSAGGALIALAALSSIFIPNQAYRRVVFFIIACVFAGKIAVVEIARLLLR
nr:hypothetical protein [Maliibacterium massiliense]